MTTPRDLMLGGTIREIREKCGLAQIALAKKSGIDPRTLAAIEKGRIATPSLSNLGKIADALNVPLRDLFGRAEARAGTFFMGSQRGEYSLEWPRQHVRVISYLPRSSGTFVGKIILESRAQCDAGCLPFRGSVFLQVIFGKMEFQLEGESHFLKEGQHVFFDGRLRYSLHNPALREATALIMTQPPPEPS